MTPDFSPLEHRWTDSGVIIEGPPDSFAICYKYQYEKAPLIINRWYPKSGQGESSIFAGAKAGDESQGLVLVQGPNAGHCPWEGWEEYPTPFSAGMMEIVDEGDRQLLLRSLSTGRMIVFDIAHRKFLNHWPPSQLTDTVLP